MATGSGNRAQQKMRDPLRPSSLDDLAKMAACNRAVPTANQSSTLDAPRQPNRVELILGSLEDLCDAVSRLEDLAEMFCGNTPPREVAKDGAPVCNNLSGFMSSLPNRLMFVSERIREATRHLYDGLN